jgi:hypothetical protein
MGVMMQIKKSMDDFIDRKILPYVFHLSEQPMLFKELLQANKLYNDGMRLEGNMPGFRIRIGRTILLFLLLWHLFFIIPGSLIFHTQLAKIDCHLLIIFAVIFTGFFFGSYALFKSWLIDRMSKKIIKKAWQNHYPHFSYELHSKEVSALYSEALEKEIPSKEIQLYILNRMIAEK